MSGRTFTATIQTLACALAMAGCAARTEGAGFGGDDVGASTDGALSFEAYRDTVYHEPWEHGIYVVDGDVPIPDDKRLREHWRARFGAPGALIVHHPGGEDARWDRARASNLTYCVSTSFGDRYDRVVAAMDAAAAEWEAAADVDLVHVEAEDGACTATNERVIFDVRPVRGAYYYARAFFPDYERTRRNVLINESSFTPSQDELTLTGILRHELGHALGFRHEHTRPESGRCYEDSRWRALTAYDRASVMHYPHCNGTGSWALEITDRDREGAAALYGPPSDEPPPEPPAEGSSHRVFVAEGEARFVGPFDVDPGTVFAAATRGWGDADLYVRFGAPPTETDFDCRPFAEGADEECHLDVPADAPRVYVSVHGRETAAVDLELAYDGAPYAGTAVDDHAAIVEVANTATLEALDVDLALDVRAATNIVEQRPFATLAALDDVAWVGPAALEAIHDYARASRSDDELVLELANTASFEVLDLDVGLDRRAAEGIVAQRPFTTMDRLDAVPYVGPVALEQLRAWARRSEEPPEEPADPPADGDAAVLELANTASFETLDVDVGLDVRAARNIVDQRPFATIAELDAVPWVGPAALEAMRTHVGATP